MELRSDFKFLSRDIHVFTRECKFNNNEEH